MSQDIHVDDDEIDFEDLKEISLLTDINKPSSQNVLSFMESATQRNDNNLNAGANGVKETVDNACKGKSQTNINPDRFSPSHVKSEQIEILDELFEAEHCLIPSIHTGIRSHKRSCILSLPNIKLITRDNGNIECLRCKSVFQLASDIEVHLQLNTCDLLLSLGDVSVKDEVTEVEGEALADRFSISKLNAELKICSHCDQTFHDHVEYLDHTYKCNVKAPDVKIEVVDDAPVYADTRVDFEVNAELGDGVKKEDDPVLSTCIKTEGDSDYRDLYEQSRSGGVRPVPEVIFQNVWLNCGCEICGEQFDSELSLVNHVLSCSGNKNKGKSKSSASTSKKASVKQKSASCDNKKTGVKKKSGLSNGKKTGVKQKSPLDNAKRTAVKKKSALCKAKKSGLKQTSASGSYKKANVKQKSPASMSKKASGKLKSTSVNKTTSVKQTKASRTSKKISVKQKTTSGTSKKASVKESASTLTDNRKSVRGKVDSSTSKGTDIKKKLASLINKRANVKTQPTKSATSTSKRTHGKDKTVSSTTKRTDAKEKSVSRAGKRTSVNDKSVSSVGKRTGFWKKPASFTGKRNTVKEISASGPLKGKSMCKTSRQVGITRLRPKKVDKKQADDSEKAVGTEHRRRNKRKQTDAPPVQNKKPRQDATPESTKNVTPEEDFRMSSEDDDCYLSSGDDFKVASDNETTSSSDDDYNASSGEEFTITTGDGRKRKRRAPRQPTEKRPRYRRSYQCDTCRRMFGSEKRLATHVTNVHPELDQAGGEVEGSIDTNSNQTSEGMSNEKVAKTVRQQTNSSVSKKIGDAEARSKQIKLKLKEKLASRKLGKKKTPDNSTIITLLTTRKEACKDSEVTRAIMCFFKNCKQIFVCENKFKQHLIEELNIQNDKITTGEMQEDRIGFDELQKKIKDLNVSAVVCSCNFPTCGHIFMGLEEVKYHYIKTHLTKATEHACNKPGCNRTFISKNELTSHVIVDHAVIVSKPLPPTIQETIALVQQRHGVLKIATGQLKPQQDKQGGDVASDKQEKAVVTVRELLIQKRTDHNINISREKVTSEGKISGNKKKIGDVLSDSEDGDNDVTDVDSDDTADSEVIQYDDHISVASSPALESDVEDNSKCNSDMGEHHESKDIPVMKNNANDQKPDETVRNWLEDTERKIHGMKTRRSEIMSKITGKESEATNPVSNTSSVSTVSADEAKAEKNKEVTMTAKGYVDNIIDNAYVEALLEYNEKGQPGNNDETTLVMDCENIDPQGSDDMELGMSLNEEADFKEQTNETKIIYDCKYQQCRESFGTKEDLKEHVQEQHISLKIYRCDHCRDVFTNLNKFLLHTNILHSVTMSGDVCPEFICRNCKLIFLSETTAIEHYNICAKHTFINLVLNKSDVHSLKGNHSRIPKLNHNQSDLPLKNASTFEENNDVGDHINKIVEGVPNERMNNEDTSQTVNELNNSDIHPLKGNLSDNQSDVPPKNASTFEENSDVGNHDENVKDASDLPLDSQSDLPSKNANPSEENTDVGYHDESGKDASDPPLDNQSDVPPKNAIPHEENNDVGDHNESVEDASNDLEGNADTSQTDNALDNSDVHSLKGNHSNYPKGYHSGPPLDSQSDLPSKNTSTCEENNDVGEHDESVEGASNDLVDNRDTSQTDNHSLKGNHSECPKGNQNDPPLDNQSDLPSKNASTCEENNDVVDHNESVDGFSNDWEDNADTSQPYDVSKFFCTKCMCFFLSQETLDWHKLAYHGRFACGRDGCLQTFPSRDLLLEHFQSHVPLHTWVDPSGSLAELRQTNKKDILFSCKQCEFISNSYKELQGHEKQAHNMLAFRCQHENCRESYDTKNKLVAHNQKCHMELDMAMLPYKCSKPGCNKAFLHKRELIAHHHESWHDDMSKKGKRR